MKRAHKKFVMIIFQLLFLVISCSARSDSRRGFSTESNQPEVKDPKVITTLRAPFGHRMLTRESNTFSVKMIPQIVHIGSTSVQINWKLEAERKESSTTTDSLGSVGLKVTYRPFGSVMEREIILINRNQNTSGFVDLENRYSVNGLQPDVGYVFCFSMLMGSQLLRSLKNEEFKRLKSNLQVNKSIVLEEKTTVKPTTTTEPPTTSEFYYTNALPLNDSIFTSNESEQRATPRRKGNYAYTSTGELVFLPASSWKPYRRKKRSEVNVGEMTNIKEQLKGRSKRLDLDENCIEIVTKPSFEYVLSPVLVLVISMTLLGVVVIVSVAVFVFRKNACKELCFLHIDDEKIQSADEANQSASKTYVKPQYEHDIVETYDKNYREELEAANPSSVSICHYHCESLPDDVGDCKRIDNSIHYDQSYYPKTVKGLTLTNKCKCPPKENFHPGYDVPPTASKEEITGYDVPKYSYRYQCALSPIASSCELNDHNSSISWDSSSSKLNVNIPKSRTKISEGEKDILDALRSTAEISKNYGVSPQGAISNKMGDSKDPKVLKLKKRARSQITSDTFSGDSENETGQECVANHEKYTAPHCHCLCKHRTNQNKRTTHSETNGNSFYGTRSAENISTALPTSSCKVHHAIYENNQTFVTEKCGLVLSDADRKVSLGDVVVSGGTLVEVPEGYVIPGTPRPTTKLKMYVKGNS